MSESDQSDSIFTESSPGNWRLKTGIEDLDRELGQLATPGHLIGVIGCTGAGKTVLATQLVRSAITSSEPIMTLFLSVEIGKRELWNRLLSSHCDISFSEFNGTSKQLMNQQGFPPMPNPTALGNDAVLRAHALYVSTRNVSYGVNDSMVKIDPSEIDSCIELFEEKLSGKKGLIILDYLEERSDEKDSFQARKQMTEVMAVLKTAASHGNLLIFAFAQAEQRKVGKAYLSPTDTQSVPDLFRDANCVIGIGRAVGDDNDDGQIYRKNQTLTVQKQNPLRPKANVSVKTNFKYQRFENRRDDNSPQGGYLPFTRKRLNALHEVGSINSISLYLFMALKARYNTTDKLVGTSWHSQDGMAKQTGLSLKQVRTAIQKLEDSELIKKKRRGNKTNYHTISGWGHHHTASGGAQTEGGYVRIPRYIQDLDYQWLSQNPELLCFWLYLIATARVFQDSDKWDLKRGHALLNPIDVEHELGIKSDKIPELLKELSSQNQIVIKEHVPLPIIKLISWHDFHPDV